MPTPITITVNGTITLEADLNDSETAAKIAAALPMELTMTRWGDEYYGACGVRAGLDTDARTTMEVGDIAFWPPSAALCFFFGPTPVSKGDQPEAASGVNPVGTILSDAVALAPLGSSIHVKVEKAK
jgi:hypothetical protein